MLPQWRIIFLFSQKFMNFITNILKLLIKLRYNVTITWLELLNSDESKLIFPSHVALMDPIILFAYLWEKKKLNPVVTENYYNVPALKRMFKLIWSIPVPDLSWSKDKELDASAIVGDVVSALKNEHNILLHW